MAMKKVIKWVLNSLPRPVLQSFASWGVPVMGRLLYFGRGVECPICGSRYRRFMPYGYVESRENALCPNCLALERHRLLWLYFVHESDILDGGKDILHIAPEVAIKRKLKRALKGCAGSYLTADLESPLADMHFDVQSIPLDGNTFDIVICNHIMEHVEDDLRALSELHRIMRKGGWGVILSPVDICREHTFEDDSITSSEERTRIFGQYDHRRIYGSDYVQRLSSAGFMVEDVDYCSQFSEKLQKLYALPKDHIYIVRKL